jgi:NADH-quinone oxidoreductase subunit L
VPLWVKVLPLVMAWVGIGLAYVYLRRKPDLPGGSPRRSAALRFLLQQVVLRRALRPRSSSPGVQGHRPRFWKKGDGAVIDGLGPDGIAARRRTSRRGA